MNGMENTLNETNDLSGFVTQLRTKFQHHCLTNVWIKPFLILRNEYIQNYILTFKVWTINLVQWFSLDTLNPRISLPNFVQSLCTHYSCFENMGQFVTLKKIRSKIWTWKKQCEKTGSFLFKKRRGQAASSLFEQQWPCFLLPAFFRSIFWTWYFLSSRP